MIRGIGPAYAKKLLRAFGEKVFDIIEATRVTPLSLFSRAREAGAERLGESGPSSGSAADFFLRLLAAAPEHGGRLRQHPDLNSTDMEPKHLSSRHNFVMRYVAYPHSYPHYFPRFYSQNGNRSGREFFAGFIAQQPFLNAATRSPPEKTFGFDSLALGTAS